MNLKKGLVLFSVGLISVIGIILLKSINSHSNNNVIAETGIIISINKIDLKIGETYLINAQVLPNNATYKSVDWIVDDSSIASIDNGLVTAKAEGSTAIRVVTKYKKIEQTIIVNVKKEIEPMLVLEKSKTMYVGETEMLAVKIVPSNIPSDIIWSSSNNAVAKISADGKVTALKKGNVTIKAKTKDGLEAACELTVKLPTLTLETTNKTLKMNNTFQIKYSITPDVKVYFNSANASVATVDDNGQVTGKNNGETTISVYVNDDIKKSFVLKVIPDTEMINLNNLSPKKYKTGIKLINPDDKNQIVAQDFYIDNIGTSGETYYFIANYKGVLTGTLRPTTEEKKQLTTALILKKQANQLTTNNSQVMFVNKTGQGQWLVKQGNYLWTAGNGGVICSGKGCSYNSGYSCSDKTACTWWGGNDANVQKLSFKSNNYGSDVSNHLYYNFGTINQERITSFMTYDELNDLMVVITKIKSKQTVATVYKASDFTKGKKTKIYQFELPTNKSIPNTSIQGYALNGGYLYRLRGDFEDGMYIEVIDMFGNYISTKKIDPGYLTKRQEAQGIKIYNNRIYFGFVYRPNCIWDSSKNNCKSGTLYEPLNAIYYMG